MVKRVGEQLCKHLLKVKQRRKIAFVKTTGKIEKLYAPQISIHLSKDFKGFRGPLDFADPRLMWKNATKGERGNCKRLVNR